MCLCLGWLVQADDPDKIVPGLFAAGEASSASVHGANRLGANSLLDIVVFGRACANRIKEISKPGAPHKDLPDDLVEPTLSRFDKLRYSNGSTPTADIRLKMQKVSRLVVSKRCCGCVCYLTASLQVMQEDAAVFRTEETLANGVKRIDEVFEEFQNDVKVVDTGLIWYGSPHYSPWMRVAHCFSFAGTLICLRRGSLPTSSRRFDVHT